MNLACQDNQFNCYYIFQWYKLLVGMILGEVNLDSGRPCRIEVDKLLATIFDTTGINVSVVGSIINSLLDNYSFEKFDIKRINLLYSLLKIPEGQSKPDNVTQEIVMTKLLNPSIFYKVFRPFKYGMPLFDQEYYMDHRINRQLALAMKDLKDTSLRTWEQSHSNTKTPIHKNSKTDSPKKSQGTDDEEQSKDSNPEVLDEDLNPFLHQKQKKSNVKSNRYIHTKKGNSSERNEGPLQLPDLERS